MNYYAVGSPARLHRLQPIWEHSTRVTKAMPANQAGLAGGKFHSVSASLLRQPTDELLCASIRGMEYTSNRAMAGAIRPRFPAECLEFGRRSRLEFRRCVTYDECRYHIEIGWSEISYIFHNDTPE